MRTASRGAGMRRFRLALGALVFGLAGALVGVVPDGVSAVAARGRCRATAFVTGAPVSTIDVKTRTKHASDIAGVPAAAGVAVTPDGKTAFSANVNGTVSTIDVKTRTKNPNDITVGTNPKGVALTPDGSTAFVTNSNFGKEQVPTGDSVSTIDVNTRTKNPNGITVGAQPLRVAVTPCRR